MAAGSMRRVCGGVVDGGARVRRAIKLSKAAIYTDRKGKHSNSVAQNLLYFNRVTFLTGATLYQVCVSHLGRL